MVDSAAGGIGLLQLVHVINVNVAVFSVISRFLNDGSVNVRLTYIFYVCLKQIYYLRFTQYFKGFIWA